MLLDLYILIYFSVYYTICDRGESIRQFINLHFTSRYPIQMNFTTYNMFTEDPMVFQMDSKVLCGICNEIYIFFGYCALYKSMTLRHTTAPRGTQTDSVYFDFCGLPIALDLHKTGFKSSFF